MEKQFDELTKRYISLRQRNRKMQLCAFYFRLKCLKTKETCQYAHGIDDLVRIPVDQMKALKKELYEQRLELSALNHCVVFNWKTQEYEIQRKDEVDAFKQNLIQSTRGQDQPLIVTESDHADQSLIDGDEVKLKS